MKYPVVLLSLLFLVGQVIAAKYTLSDNYQGSSFLNEWDFEAIADPTHGYVNYVSKSTAQSKGLVSVSGSNFTLRADDTSVPSSSASGRDSVRIQSQKSYNTHVTVINIAHMPKGCGTWPAIWEKGPNWPNNGEVDIIEGANDVPPNQSTLHTSSGTSFCPPPSLETPVRSCISQTGCTMPSSRSMTGTAISSNCDSSGSSNTGCGVAFPSDDSYGHEFNVEQGGFYAMERTSSFVKVWFWPRGASNIPSDVKNGAGTINTGKWGTPGAYFPNTNCNIGSHFHDNNIVINLTFCGDLAGNTYASSGCPGTCNSFVRNNPGQFTWAYFLIMWMKVYE
ncbi:endo-beta-glucanase [Amylostereum chailletii]|nr:endo-beta-glucanase [Amylostereum chailletii]